MIGVLLLLAAAGLVAYAITTQYSHTDPGKSVPARVWASIVAATAMIAAALTSWFHSVTPPAG